MGDVPSCSFEEGFPVDWDEEFFIHFTHLFPLPHHFPHTGPGQPTRWRHVTPPSGITSLREVARFLDSRGIGDPRRSTPG
jgi:hypothetical protein